MFGNEPLLKLILTDVKCGHEALDSTAVLADDGQCLPVVVENEFT